ncbi:hypothetical protein C8K30_105222 [Promicromonospora sp. AC04]|nr:hypothetical protein C8K30_105222 [Promicromonospora sp. AC04]
MDPPEEPSSEALAVSRRVRGLVVAVWVLLLAHFVATFVWTAPGYVLGRPEDEGGTQTPSGAHRALETYMTPVFAQNWSIFAPSPLHVEYALRVRGGYARGPDGAVVPGPWIDTTAVEVRALTGHLLPAATERPSRRLASDARAAYLALPDDARVMVLAPPPDGQHAADADPWPGLRAALLDTGAAPDAVDQYLGMDRALAAYATQVLLASPAEVREGAPGTASTGQDPVYVQVSIVRHALAPHGTAERPEPTELTLGARPPVVVRGQDAAAFRATWDALQNDALQNDAVRDDALRDDAVRSDARPGEGAR